MFDLIDALWAVLKGAAPLIIQLLGIAAVAVGCFLLATWLGFVILGLLLLLLGWVLE